MSNSMGVDVMDQMANASDVNAGNVAQTPLAHTEASPVTASASVNSSVTLTELPLCGLLVLRAVSAQEALSAALQKQIGLTLPATLQSQENGDYCLRWITPDEWILSCPNSETFSLETSLRDAVEGHIAIVNVTGANSILRLSGRNARNVLRKSTVYDVNPENMTVAKVVSTTFAKAQATIRALPDDAFELIIRRSFADYVWLWLQRAGKEYDMQFEKQSL